MFGIMGFIICSLFPLFVNTLLKVSAILEKGSKRDQASSNTSAQNISRWDTEGWRLSVTKLTIISIVGVVLGGSRMSPSES